jgi:hypothetical protein
MGFHKRYLDIDIVHRSLKENKIVNLFTKADALFFEDNESSHIYALFMEGKTNQELLEIVEKLKINNNEDN